jgi:hypothetical protein
MERRYIGIDLHRNRFTCCIRLENERTYVTEWALEALGRFVKKLRATDEVAVEITSNTRLFFDAVAPQVKRVGRDGKYGGTTNMNAAGQPIAGDVDFHLVESPVGRTTLHLFQIDKASPVAISARITPPANMTPQGRVTCCASQARTLRRALSKIRS